MARRGKKPHTGPVVDGILLVDKPSGMTSHDVVHKVRKHFNLKKVGHGGTLDPQATGLLVLLLGKGTKASQWVMVGDKRYWGEVTLGVVTSSQDAEGEVLEENDASGVTQEALAAECATWDGEIEQIPPMVSAIKKGGVPLYKLARQGKEIEREPRVCELWDFELLDVALPKFAFRVDCSKGTYMRTLAHDIGENLGVGGHLSALRREASGDYDVADAHELEAILAMEVDELREVALPVPPPPPPPEEDESDDEAFAHG